MSATLCRAGALSALAALAIAGLVAWRPPPGKGRAAATGFTLAAEPSVQRDIARGVEELARGPAGQALLVEAFAHPRPAPHAVWALADPEVEKDGYALRRIDPFFDAALRELGAARAPPEAWLVLWHVASYQDLLQTNAADAARRAALARLEARPPADRITRLHVWMAALIHQHEPDTATAMCRELHGAVPELLASRAWSAKSTWIPQARRCSQRIKGASVSGRHGVVLHAAADWLGHLRDQSGPGGALRAIADPDWIAPALLAASVDALGHDPFGPALVVFALFVLMVGVASWRARNTLAMALEADPARGRLAVCAWTVALVAMLAPPCSVVAGWAWVLHSEIRLVVDPPAGMGCASPYSSWFRLLPEVLRIELRDGVDLHGDPRWLGRAAGALAVMAAALLCGVWATAVRDGRSPRWVHLAAPLAAVLTFGGWREPREHHAALACALVLLLVGTAPGRAAHPLRLGGLALLAVQLLGSCTSGSWDQGVACAFLVLAVFVLPAWCGYLRALPAKPGGVCGRGLPAVAVGCGWYWLATAVALPTVTACWFEAAAPARAAGLALIAACAAVPMAAEAWGRWLAPEPR